MQKLDKMSEMENIKRQFPEPAFPAQEAWTQMKEMLNEEMPSTDRKKRFGFLWFFAAILLGGAIWYGLKPGSSKETAKTNIAALPEEKKAATQPNPDNNIITNSTTATDEDVPANELSEATDETSTIISAPEKRIEQSSVSLKSKKVQSAKNLSAIKNNKLSDDNNNYESFADIQKMKARFDKTYKLNAIVSTQAPGTQTALIPYTQPEAEEKTVAIAEVKKTTAPVTKNVHAVTTTIKVPKPKYDNSLHYGLQWNILLPQANSYLDYKAKQQPLTIVVPEFWVSKAISHKSELSVQLNPFSQYTLNSNNVLETNKYPVTIMQGSGQSTTVNYVQTRSLVKSMGIELTAKYTYKISNKLNVSLGIGNNWVNAAVINDRITSKGEIAVRDSLYGIAKSFKEWDYLKSSFLVGRLEALYKLNNFQVGVAFLKPLGNIYTFDNNQNNPVNGRLVLRWMIK